MEVVLRDDDLNLKLPPDPLRPEGQTTDSDDEGLYLEDSSNLADSELDFSSAISGASPPGTSPPGASKRGKQKRNGVRKPGRCSKKSRASLKPKTDSKSELTPGADTFEAAFVASALSSGRKARATTLPKYSPEILDCTCGNKGSEIEGMETPTVWWAPANSGKLGGPAAKEGELFDGIKNPLFVFWGEVVDQREERRRQDLLSYRPAATDAIEQAEKCQLWWGLGQPCTEGAVTNHAVGTVPYFCFGASYWKNHPGQIIPRFLPAGFDKVIVCPMIDLPKKLRMGQHGNLEEDNRSAGSKDSKGGKGSKGALASAIAGSMECNSSPAPPGKPTGDEELTGDEEAPGALLPPSSRSRSRSPSIMRASTRNPCTTPSSVAGLYNVENAVAAVLGANARTATRTAVGVSVAGQPVRLYNALLPPNKLDDQIRSRRTSVNRAVMGRTTKWLQ
eukprot:g53967.t1